MTDNNVVNFTGDTKLDLPADRILQSAIEADLDVAIIVGFTKDGQFYFASSVADLMPVHWYLSQAQKKLLEMDDE